MRVLVVLLIVVLTAAVPARAQTAPPLPASAPLRGVSKVFVQEAGTADPIRGQLARIDASTLTLLVDGQRREIPFDRILRIDVPGDSVKDGAIIGAVVGVVLVALAGGFSHDGPAAVPLVFWTTTYSALAGAGIDALHVGRTSIYKRPDGIGAGPDDKPRLRVAFNLRF